MILTRELKALSKQASVALKKTAGISGSSDDLKEAAIQLDQSVSF